MKLKKFRQVTTRHPELEQVMLDEARFFMGNKPNRLKAFLTEKVEYIAYHPFSKLDLSASEVTKSSGPLKGFYAHQRIWDNTDYQVYFWVGNEKRPRARSVSNEEPTIRDVIFQLHDWHLSSALKYPKELTPLKWGFVLQRFSEGGVNGVVNVHYIVYEFPADFDASRAFPQYSVYDWLDDCAHDAGVMTTCPACGETYWTEDGHPIGTMCPKYGVNAPKRETRRTDPLDDIECFRHPGTYYYYEVGCPFCKAAENNKRV